MTAPSRSGFSLTELLFVLAIIGALVSASLPQYAAYVARTERAEALSHLATLATAEHGFCAEHNTYTDDLRRIPFGVSGKPRYLYGFTSDGVPDASGVNDTAELAASGRGGFATERMIDPFGAVLSEVDLPPAAVTAESFVVGAVGNVDQDGTVDRWTIDRNANLVNVTNDLDH